MLYGTYDTEGYLSAISDGEVEPSLEGYYAAWIAADGRIDAVTSHYSHRDGKAQSFAEGYVRLVAYGHGRELSVGVSYYGTPNPVTPTMAQVVTFRALYNALTPSSCYLDGKLGDGNGGMSYYGENAWKAVRDFQILANRTN